MPAPVRSVAELAAAGPRTPVRFLFFWGHRPERDGSIGAGCLSQWWPSPFTVDGSGSPRRALHDVAQGHSVRRQRDGRAGTGGAAPACGQDAGPLRRQVRSASWDEHRYGIVVTGNLGKFGQHPPLRAFLLGTGERVLVEGSPVDRVWGIGRTRDDPATADPGRWPRLNLLGFALMQVRAQLREQAPAGGQGFQFTDDGVNRS